MLVKAADPLDEWTWRNPLPTPEDFQAVTYARGTFVAAGNLGTVFTSTNGMEWTQRTLPDEQPSRRMRPSSRQTSGTMGLVPSKRVMKIPSYCGGAP